MTQGLTTGLCSAVVAQYLKMYLGCRTEAVGTLVSGSGGSTAKGLPRNVADGFDHET
jgi:hypothetical protein